MQRRDWLIGGGVVLAVLAIGVGVALSMRGRAGTGPPDRHLTAEELTGDPNQGVEDASAAAVERLGGTAARTDLKRGNPHVFRATLKDRPVTDADLKNLRGLTWMTHLDLQGTGVTDAGLTELRPLEWLTVLDLSRTGVTGPGLAELEALPRLREVSLARTRVTDESLTALAGLTALQTLDLSGSPVTGPGLDRLKGRSALRTLKVSRTGVTDDGLAHLAALPDLVELDLSHTPVTDAGITKLKALTRLEVLNLAGTKVTGRSAAVIARLGLRRVDLTGVPLGADEYVTLRGARSRPIPAVPRPGGKDPGPDTVIVPLAVVGVAGAITDEWLEVLVRKGQLHLLVEDAASRGEPGKADRTPGIADGGKDGRRPATGVLNLSGSRVTDAGLRYLEGSGDFGRLRLTGTAVTDGGIEALKKARPDLIITK